MIEMAYKNKTYVCFDADNDMNYYNLMKAWKEHGSIAFDFHNAHEINTLRDGSSEETIKKKLRERLQNTRVLVVLVGKHTKNLYKYVRWEIAYALECHTPIVCVNLNGKNKLDSNLCPPVIRDELAVHIPYGQKEIDHALNSWPVEHAQRFIKGEKGDCFYSEFGA
jgi:Thoeris protein ThsB, TIR-like domain